MEFFHGTTATLAPADLTDGLCLADDPAVSEAYLHGQTGRVYTIAVDTRSISIADHDDLEQAAAALDITDWADYGGYFVLADRADVRAWLREQGYGAVSYLDQVAEGDYDAATLRLLTAGIARITHTEEYC